MSQEEHLSGGKPASLVKAFEASADKSRTDSRSSEDDFVILESEDMNDNIKTEDEAAIMEHAMSKKHTDSMERKSESRSLVSSVPLRVPGRLARSVVMCSGNKFQIGFGH